MLRWASPPSLNVIFASSSSCTFCRAGRRDHHLTLYRCYSSVTGTTRLLHHGLHLRPLPIFTRRYCVYPLYFWFVTFVLYSFLSYFVTFLPLLWYIDRGLYGYYGYSRINVGHVWALEHCVATGIQATTDYTCTIPD